MKLVDMMAAACTFAQGHISDWDISVQERQNMLECVSYQMACFLAEWTVGGNGGVEWEIVIDKLVELPVKGQGEWVEILNSIADNLGGWTSEQ